MEALPRELALRIALASRILPGIDIPRLLGILHERVGSPLDDEKLKSITVTNLKTGLGSLDGEEDGEDIGIGLAISNWRFDTCGATKPRMKICRKSRFIRKAICPIPSVSRSVRTAAH